MQNNSENIIMFPKWKMALENESLQALEDKKYKEALSKLNILISYGNNDHEIVLGKMICLMELERFEEAQEVCEELLTYKDENYYHYFHLYLTILFQTSQYDILIEQVEHELLNNNLPKIFKEQFQQLLTMSKQMQDSIIRKESGGNKKELFQIINGNNYLRQWQLLENMRKMGTRPMDEINLLLKNEKIHPAIKTVIFKWLQDQKVDEYFLVQKFGKEIKVNPSKIAKIRDHYVTKQTLLLISELEQNNPSLFIMLEQLLYRYIYILYPLVPAIEDVPKIAEALSLIGEQYLHNNEQDIDENMEYYIDEIKMCEALFLSIIEE